MDIRAIIAKELRATGASPEKLTLWEEIATEFEGSGPDGVKDLISKRVKDARKRATKEAKEIGEVAATVAKPKKKKGRK